MRVQQCVRFARYARSLSMILHSPTTDIYSTLSYIEVIYIDMGVNRKCTACVVENI